MPFLLACLAIFLSPLVASAHEVYLLPHDAVIKAIDTPAFSEWNVIVTNIDQFLLWGFIASLVIFVVFFASISRHIENICNPFFAKLPPYAPVISRVTIGISFIAGGYFGALFGPELPIAEVFGNITDLIKILLVIIGFMITVGFYPRLAAALALLLFVAEIYVNGSYMITYTNYLGEILLLLIIGAHAVAVHDKHTDSKELGWFLRLKNKLIPFVFPLLRIAFGISLVYASLYAKVIHNQLALSVAYAYPGLVSFFGFEPHFLVVGAAIIEVLIGTFFILGIEIRFTSLFLLFWLSLSLWYFGEVVWPHLILIGIPIAFIFYGYDPYSVEGALFKKNERMPVL